MTVGVIWAQARDGVIGRDGAMPWHIPEDAAYFRRVTSGHAVVMGRLTWESLPDRFRPLPDRRNIVISRRPGLTLPGAEVAPSPAAALALAGPDRSWVIGGGQIYAAALPLASEVLVTEIDLRVAGDVHAPPLTGWRVAQAGEWQVSAGGARFRWLRYHRSPGGRLSGG
jgi:dihydrofolate reductase